MKVKLSLSIAVAALFLCMALVGMTGSKEASPFSSFVEDGTNTPPSILEEYKKAESLKKQSGSDKSAKVVSPEPLDQPDTGVFYFKDPRGVRNEVDSVPDTSDTNEGYVSPTVEVSKLTPDTNVTPSWGYLHNQDAQKPAQVNGEVKVKTAKNDKVEIPGYAYDNVGRSKRHSRPVIDFLNRVKGSFSCSSKSKSATSEVTPAKKATVKAAPSCRT